MRSGPYRKPATAATKRKRVICNDPAVDRKRSCKGTQTLSAAALAAIIVDASFLDDNDTFLFDWDFFSKFVTERPDILAERTPCGDRLLTNALVQYFVQRKLPKDCEQTIISAIVSAPDEAFGTREEHCFYQDFLCRRGLRAGHGGSPLLVIIDALATLDTVRPVSAKMQRLIARRTQHVDLPDDVWKRAEHVMKQRILLRDTDIFRHRLELDEEFCKLLFDHGDVLTRACFARCLAERAEMDVRFACFEPVYQLYREWSGGHILRLPDSLENAFRYGADYDNGYDDEEEKRDRWRSAFSD